MDKKNRNTKPYVFVGILFLILMLPSILLILIGEDSVSGSFIKKCVFLLISFSIISIPLVFLKPKYYSYFVLLLFPLVIFESYHIYIFKTPSSEEVIATIFQTNYNETKELLISNSLLILVAIFVFMGILFISRKIKSDFKLSKKQKWSLLFIFLFTFITLEIRNFKLAFQLNDKKTEIIGAANYALEVQLKKNFPVGIFLKSLEVKKGFKAQKAYVKAITNFSFNAIKKDSLQEQEIYVLVLGETARKNNFHIYNYNRETSPNLDSIRNLLAFNNVHTNANLTSLSIPFILTRATPKNASLKFKEPAIINAFKEVGFKTYWLSNQPYGTGSPFILYSSLADSYKNISTSLDAANFDEKLIPVLEEVLSDSHPKKLIILHTIGSHFRYNYRYPKKFHIFKPTLQKGLSIETTNSISNKKEIVNSYDNSILYTDFVLSKIIKKLKEKNAVSYMYYISDHGENLFDTDANKILHGFETPSKYEIEIPLFIWTSSKYNKLYSEKRKNLSNNINRKIASVNTFQTILDMSHISYPNFENQKSFAHKKFDTLQKRTFYTVNKTVLKID
ncbi:phosphoethanolamine transferase [Polaribacter batillariae]|uniref:Phosphoethanolamine transferase n=1 Tax=Polaribacter batillariae TaxID=2808900 RepID=A0ABX7SU76_9FLAO|nr:phosphoethanolamine transferase [Polaribacter batillariae]QTD37792.1 phosphoethanolamine transferase [Polaribacter batillariae]